MGTIKKAAKKIIENYYDRLTSDFQVNKRIVQETTDTPTKKIRNKIAGFVTHLMKRIQNGPVRGISLTMQEESRERKMDYIPDQSALDPLKKEIFVDELTMKMLKDSEINIEDIRLFEKK